jgi:hypothetical protein
MSWIVKQALYYCLLLKPVMPITSIAMPLIAYQKTSNARTCVGFLKALPVLYDYMR